MGPALAGKLEALADAHGAHAQLFDLCEAQGDWQRLLDHMAASAAGELECQWQGSNVDPFSLLGCHRSLKSCYKTWCGEMVLGPLSHRSVTSEVAMVASADGCATRAQAHGLRGQRSLAVGAPPRACLARLRSAC